MIIAILAAAILGIAGAGIFAIPVVVILLFGAAFLFMRQAASPEGGQETSTSRTPASTGTGTRATGTPQDTASAGTHQETGYAHAGQEHMTPEQLPR